MESVFFSMEVVASLNEYKLEFTVLHINKGVGLGYANPFLKHTGSQGTDVLRCRSVAKEHLSKTEIHLYCEEHK